MKKVILLIFLASSGFATDWGVVMSTATKSVVPEIQGKVKVYSSTTGNLKTDHPVHCPHCEAVCNITVSRVSSGKRTYKVYCPKHGLINTVRK